MLGKRKMVLISAAIAAIFGFSGARAETLIEEALGSAAILGDQVLEGQRGGDGPMLNVEELKKNAANLKGNVSGNPAAGMAIGTSTLDGSFHSAQGLFTAINNFGRNSLIQEVRVINADVHR